MIEYDQIILGEGVSFTTDTSLTQINDNVLVVGGTGSGKTCSVIEPLLLNCFNSSLIVSVSKKVLVEKYTPVFEARGYKVFHIDTVNPLQSTAFFDPLLYINDYGDIISLSQKITEMDEKRSHSHADPFWINAASALLNGLISLSVSKSQRKNESPNFADVLSYFDEMEFSAYDEGMLTYSSLDGEFEGFSDGLVKSWWRSFRELPIRTASCVFSELSLLLTRYFNGAMREVFRQPEKYKPIDFSKIAKEKTVVFLSTSAVDSATHAFANLFIGMAIKELFEFAEQQPNGKLPIPFRLVCDDFAVSAKIDRFDQMVSIFREKEMSSLICLQSESQLENLYGKAQATTIINNADTLIFMGGNDLLTARNISERANIPFEDALNLPLGMEWIFRRGCKPICRKRYDIFSDKAYQEITAMYKASVKKKEKTPFQKPKFNFLTGKYGENEACNNDDKNIAPDAEEVFEDCCLDDVEYYDDDMEENGFHNSISILRKIFPNQN